MLVVRKKNNSLRIRLAPKDLNQGIQIEIYPIATVEEIAAKFSGAQVFTFVDVKSGYWHIPHHEEFTYLTCSNKTFFKIQISLWYLISMSSVQTGASVCRRVEWNGGHTW